MEQKDTEQKNNLTNGHVDIGHIENELYRKHSSLSIIVKKTEKIVTAIYMVTDFIHESEPLRSQLRTLSLSLISGTRKIGAHSSEPHYVLSDEIIRTIEETEVLIRLASTIGIVSEMNGAVLTNELNKIKDEIKKEYGDKKVSITTHPGYANILLNPSMFEIPQTDPAFPVRNYKGQENSNGQNLNNNVLYKKESDNFLNTGIVKANEKVNVSFSRKNDIGNKIARRNDVLNIVRNKIKVSIKDISMILKDTSEKTIQRELLGLVKEGVLVKEGEKRWSTYRIAS